MYNLYDDLRVVGTDDKEHDENLGRVMRKLQESGITLSYDKCEIGVPSMTYMGDVLSGEGLKLSDERVKAQKFPWIRPVLCEVHRKLFLQSQVHCGT